MAADIRVLAGDAADIRVLAGDGTDSFDSPLLVSLQEDRTSSLLKRVPSESCVAQMRRH